VTLYRRVVLITVSAVACLSAAAVYDVTSGTDEAIAVPVPDTRVAGYCHALHQELPSKVSGLSRHDLKTRSELVAGWGIRPSFCAAVYSGPRSTTTPTAAGWTSTGRLVDRAGAGGAFRLTTTLRKAYVEVTLPKKFAGDVGPLTDFADAVKKTIPAL